MGLINKIIYSFKLAAKSIFTKFKSLSFKKKIIVIILCVITFLFSFNMFFGNNKNSQYILAKANISNVTETVSETGIITTNGKTEVFSPTDGVIENVLINNNEIVTKGQDLFTVISNATEQEQQLAYSNYLAAKSLSDNASSTAIALRSSMYTNWDNFYDLSTGDNYENSDGSPKTTEREAAEYQTAQDNWKAAEKKYKDQETAIWQAQSALNSAWLQYQATQNSTVKAPIDGLITNLSVTTGKSVNIKSLQNLDPVLIITNKADTEVKVSITESDIVKIKPNQETIIEFDAFKNKNYKGFVARVDTIGTNNQGVVRYNVYIKITNPDDNLRPGMSADVEITTNTAKNVITVPNSSIKPYKGGRAVRVLNIKTKQQEYIPVVVGIKGKDKSEIKSGLKNQQEIITALSNDLIKRPGLLGN